MAWILHRQSFSWAPVTWRIQTACSSQLPILLAFSCIDNCCFLASLLQHCSQLRFPMHPMGVQLLCPQTRLKNVPILLFCCFGLCNCSVPWEPSAEFTLFLAFPPRAVSATGAGAFLPVTQQLKVTANFCARFYHMLQMPLRCFFLCYLQMLLYIDFFFFAFFLWGAENSGSNPEAKWNHWLSGFASSSVIYLMPFSRERVCYFQMI